MYCTDFGLQLEDENPALGYIHTLEGRRLPLALSAVDQTIHDGGDWEQRQLTAHDARAATWMPQRRLI